MVLQKYVFTPEYLFNLLVINKQKRIKDFVYLRRDVKGYYLEYAFCKGEPDDNRCLSWYITGSKEHNIKPQFVVDKIYELLSFTCDGHCSVGCPTCKNVIDYWDYNKPIKCACWSLGDELNINKYIVHLNIDELCNIFNKS